MIGSFPAALIWLIPSSAIFLSWVVGRLAALGGGCGPLWGLGLSLELLWLLERHVETDAFVWFSPHGTTSSSVEPDVLPLLF